MRSSLLLFFFLSLSFLTEADRLLGPAESQSLRIVFGGLRRGSQNFFCGSRGISCEQRITGVSSELRSDRIAPGFQGLEGSPSPAVGLISDLTAQNQTLGFSGSPLNSPTASSRRDSGGKLVKKSILAFLKGAVAGIVFALVFYALFRFAMNCVRRRCKKTRSIFSPIMRTEDLSFLEKENAFSSLEIIGRGGCGVVYKASLPGSKMKLVAIKKISHPAMSGSLEGEGDSAVSSKMMKQIRSEVQTVGRIRHRNLLPLLAHVAQPSCHCLVYEFMANGSLQDALRQVSQGSRKLDWPARLRIAAGIAAGLEYLHFIHRPQIVHRDLKPGNILLDCKMEARIADFGLAKPMAQTHNHMTTSNVAGTVGFIAPEYHQTLKFTDKCDVYSFGVLLVTLVTGKLPSDEFFETTEEVSLVKWLRSAMRAGNPWRAVDPELLGRGFDSQMLLVLKIACFCTLEDPNERPTSKDVRRMLSQLQSSEDPAL